MSPRVFVPLSLAALLLGTAPAIAAAPPAPATPPAAAPAPIAPTSEAGLTNYQKGLAGLKKIGNLYAFVTHEPSLDAVQRVNVKDYDYIRYQVIETGADWALFTATHAAVQADPALRAKLVPDGPKSN